MTKMLVAALMTACVVNAACLFCHLGGIAGAWLYRTEASHPLGTVTIPAGDVAWECPNA